MTNYQPKVECYLESAHRTVKTDKHFSRKNRLKTHLYKLSNYWHRNFNNTTGFMEQIHSCSDCLMLAALDPHLTPIRINSSGHRSSLDVLLFNDCFVYIS